jgi:thiamine transport system permease protein
MKGNAVKLLLALFFLFPLFVLFYFFKIDLNYNAEEIFWALKNSFIQSFATASISVFFGYFGALGIAGTSGLLQKILRLSAIVPAFLPPLFSVMIGMAIIPGFPRGTYGVIYILSLVYVGFAASVLSGEVMTQMGRLGFVGQVYGLSKFKFHTQVLFPIVGRSAVFVFAAVFVQALTSFTIPLLVGGGRGVNFEVLIFEKIFIEQKWSMAVGLSILQLSLVAVLALCLRARKDVVASSFVPSRLVSLNVGVFGLVLYLLLYFWGYLKLVFWMTNIYYFNQIFSESFYTAVWQSFIFFFFVLALFFILYCAVLYLRYQLKSVRFLNFFLTPSSVLVGFACYLLLPANSMIFDFLKLALVFCIVGFVSFFKSIFENQMQLFDQQMKVARSFGLSFSKFIFTIYFPQIKKSLHYAVSLIFIFSISEYGLVKASGAGIKTLGTEMAAYLSSYRIEGAFVISIVILAVWLVTTLISGALLGVYKKS